MVDDVEKTRTFVNGWVTGWEEEIDIRTLRARAFIDNKCTINLMRVKLALWFRQGWRFGLN